MSELIPLSLSIANRGNVPIQEVFVITPRGDFFMSSKDMDTSYSDVSVYPLLEKALQPGEEQKWACFYHLTEEDNPGSFNYLLVIHSQEEWRVICGEEHFEVSPLLRVSVMKLPVEESCFYRCIVNNVHEEQAINAITVRFDPHSNQ